MFWDRSHVDAVERTGLGKRRAGSVARLSSTLESMPELDFSGTVKQWGGRQTRLSAAAFFGSLAVFGTGLVALAVYETYAIGTGKQPITDYVKNEIRKQPMWADMVLLAAGILIGHFWSSAPAVVEPNS